MKKSLFKDMKYSLKDIKITNLVPGTLVYKGNSNEDFTIQVLEYTELACGQDTYNSTEEFFKEHINLESQDKVMWINIIGINHIEEIRKFSQRLNISNLIMEQVLHISNHSTNQYSEEFVFNDIQKIYLSDDKEFVSENISLFKRNNIVITFHERNDSIFEDIRNRLLDNEGNLRRQSSNYLYYSLIDAITDYYLVTLEAIGREIERLEEKVVNVEDVNIKNIHMIKKQLMILKFSAGPIEKMINSLIENPKILPLENPQYLLNLQGHIKEVVNDIGLQRGYIDSLFENFVLNNSNDMNRVMTTLTIFSAIFIPLSFAAGVFGMNFENIPGLNNPLAFLYFLVGCGLTAVSMLVFFKVNKWF